VFIPTKVKFVNMRVNVKKLKTNADNEVLILQSAMTILPRKQLKKQNITLNMVDSILSPSKLTTSSIVYTLKFDRIIYVACMYSTYLTICKFCLKEIHMQTTIITVMKLCKRIITLKNVSDSANLGIMM
jgi:hypothetical protein